MQKATLLPLYFDPGRDEEFDEQLARLRQMIGDLVDFADPQPLGGSMAEADAVILPQILGEAYRRLDAFDGIDVPILIVTTEFGTLAMWDWEIRSWLASFGVQTIAPYSLEDTRKVCSALNVKKELEKTTFLIFQDNPGEGFQPSISSDSTGGSKMPLEAWNQPLESRSTGKASRSSGHMPNPFRMRLRKSSWSQKIFRVKGSPPGRSSAQ